MANPVIVLGGGGHARVVIDALRLSDIEILGISDKHLAKGDDSVAGIEVIGSDEDVVARFSPQQADLVSGIGSLPGAGLRMQLFTDLSEAGYRFRAVVHPAAVVAADVEVRQGAQIMAGAIVQPGTVIGENCIINTGASVDHDCQIGDHSHVAPGAVLGGGVELSRNVHIGSGATVIQQIRIGEDVVVGAGAVVTSDVAAQQIVYPARSTIKSL